MAAATLTLSEFRSRVELAILFITLATITTYWIALAQLSVPVAETAAVCYGITAICTVLRRLLPAHGPVCVIAAPFLSTCLYTAALAGTPWQGEAHVFLLVTLAGGGYMASKPAIIAVATAAIAYFGIVGTAAPALVYVTHTFAENWLRILAQTSAVACTAYYLFHLSYIRERLDRQNDDQRAELATALAEASSAQAEAERQRAFAEAEGERVRMAFSDAQSARADAEAEAARAVSAETDAASARAREDARARADADAQSKALDALATALDALAAGRIEMRIEMEMPPGFERLAGDYNRAVAALARVVGTVSAHTDALRGKTNAVVRLSDEHGALDDRRIAGTIEFARRLAVVREGVAQTSASARGTERAAEAMRREADEGASVMRRATEAMGSLEAAAGEVRTVTAVIEDIAFQTNLLALNAGVEAARAGEAGRGFAVVATEVRALAQRSSEAVARIGTILSRSEASVTSGVSLVGETGERLAAITAAIDEATALMSDMATGAGAQADAIAQLGDWADRMTATETDASAARTTARRDALADLQADAAEVAAAVAGFVARAPGAAGGERAA